MAFFDVSKQWVIRLPELCDTAAVRDLAGFLNKTRVAAGVKGDIQILSAEESSGDSCEIIINCDRGSKKNGYAWRIGCDRVEIYGHSLRSSDNAVYDFIRSLGGSFSGAGEIITPAAGNGIQIPCRKAAAHFNDDGKRTRVFIKRGLSAKETMEAVLNAGRGAVDEVVLSLAPAFDIKTASEVSALAARFHLEVSRGGEELEFFVPRNLFFFHREYFRMEGGRRVKNLNFCASNNKTRDVIARSALTFFNNYTACKKYYLFASGAITPEENVWWSCPACRA
ncbi:MAG: hypothetical protein LBC77_03415, partial [Spirochaetaceae bacterium]|nr:hypothetical protein [Spirochaetaceae bacterium]